MNGKLQRPIRLAAKLEVEANSEGGFVRRNTMIHAAKLLRQLHEKNGRLKEQCDKLLESLKEMAAVVDAFGDEHDMNVAPHVWWRLDCERLLTKAKNAILDSTDENGGKS